MAPAAAPEPDVYKRQGYQVAQKQPMKLAAMEGYYEGRQGAGLVAFGLLNPAKQTPQDGVRCV